jgi:gluconolactonase
MTSRLLNIVATMLALTSPAFAAPSFPPVPDAGLAATVVDLATVAGAAQLHAQWRYSDVKIVEAPFRAVGSDNQPGTGPVMTYDIAPHAGAAEFDDSKWQAIGADTLGARRGNGRISFNWYRTKLTVPEQVNGFSTKGATLVFETSIDDYAEVWVDGELPHALGQSGGSVIAGWNAPNRLVIGRNVQPGQEIQLAVFGANGPLSSPPTNYIYFHEAKLEFHPADIAVPYALPPHEVNVEVIRKDPAIDAIVPVNAKVYKLAQGFQFTEGPVFVPQKVGDGYLLFSDPNANRIYKLTPSGDLSVFRERSGYEGADIAEYHQPGSNGLTLSPDGHLTINQHGNRRVMRLEADGSLSVLADNDSGRRLNSPNDLVYRSDGTLYFTDPPFGLPRFGDDPRKQLPYSGVYMVRPDAKSGSATLLTKEFSGPNGIAFSPDEKFLYVGDWDDHYKVVKRYPVKADGSLGAGTLFLDMTKTPGEDAIDGIKVDSAGNVYVSGPGGLWIISPSGKHLGTIVTPKHAHNFTFGDADGRTLYLCARDSIYRIRLNIPGIRPQPATVQIP